jgi:purine-binding chemotaxis protein CheW
MTPRTPRFIDWNDARQRVARAGERLKEALEPSPEQARRVMDERARSLAIAVADGTAAHGIEVITFTAGRELFAVETRYVIEIVQVEGLVPLPGVAAFVAGIENVRGEILLVIDLLKLCGTSELAPAERRWVVVIGQNHAEVGIVASDVHEVTRLPADALFTLPYAQTQLQRDPIAGVTDRALVLLDGAALLADERLFIDHGAEATA